MRTFFMLTLLSIASLCAGCASHSLTQNQCVAGDWQTVGHRDGQSGLSSTSLLTHQDACGEFGVIPDRTQYLAGWNQGVLSYCRADNGFALGEQGSSYNDVCPTGLRGEFLGSYDQGRELYVARRDVQQLESTLSRNHARKVKIDARVLELTAAQVEPTLTPTKRVELFTQTKNLLEEKKRIEHDLPELEYQLDQAIARLERLEYGS